MKSRQYNTELGKEEFFTKLEKYSVMNFTSMPIIGRLKNGKGIFECGGRATKRFSIEFINEKQIQVQNHICIMDIIFFCGFIAMLVMAIIMSISEGIGYGLLFALFPIFFCGMLLLSQMLPWNRVDKALKKDFVCSRILTKTKQ